MGRTVDGIGTSKSTDPLLRISQLEQNIRFLQEQHQQMLTGLHEEIDSLRQRNRGMIGIFLFITVEINSRQLFTKILLIISSLINNEVHIIKKPTD